jgi:hypothetical protein
MSEETKKHANDVKEFYKEIGRKSTEITKTIPDKKLSEKIQKVQESSQEVVKYLEEKK